MTIKKKLAIGTAGVLAVVGTGSALAAKSHGKNAARGNVTLGPVSDGHGHDGHGHDGHGHDGHGHDGRGGDDLAAAAAYLGVTDAALVADLQSGKTLAQVASTTTGKTTAGLIAALVTHETAELNAAFTAGRLTRAQADTMIADLSVRFTGMANGVRPDGGPRGPHDGGHRP